MGNGKNIRLPFQLIIESKGKSLPIILNQAEKIAMLGTLPPLRGLSSYCHELVQAMVNVVPIEFVSFKKLYPAFAYPGGGLSEDTTFPSLNHPDLTVSRHLTWYNPFGWIKAGLLSSARLMHAQWWSLPLFPIYLTICGIFKAQGKPVVFTVHNTRPHEKSSLFQAVSGLVFKLGDHFIVHTATNRDQMIKDYGVAEDKISLIPHGPLDLHIRAHGDRNSIRDMFGFNNAHKVILLFGAIRPYKGIETALKAFKEVHQRIPDSRLLIAGKLWGSWEPYSNLIDALNIRSAISTHLNYIPSGEVFRYFIAADLVVLPYHHFDSQSGVGASALSFQKPLIVSQVGGLPDLVEDPRSVVPPNDSASLAQALLESLQNPGRLNEMSAASERISQKMSWPAIAHKTLAVYQKVLSRSIPSSKVS